VRDRDRRPTEQVRCRPGDRSTGRKSGDSAGDPTAVPRGIEDRRWISHITGEIVPSPGARIEF